MSFKPAQQKPGKQACVSSLRYCSNLLFAAAVCLLVFPSRILAEKPALWFPVGEIITYEVYWVGLTVAEVKIWTEWLKKDNMDLLAIRVTIKTRSVMDVVYPVDDFLESVVEPKSFLPLRFTRNLAEGRYRLHEVTTFNHKTLKGHWKHLLKNDEQVFEIEPDTRDFLSFMFSMRRANFEVGGNYTYRVMADEKIYDLIVQGLEQETVKLAGYGKTHNIKVEPKATFKGLIARVGRMFMWISQDSRKLCTKATISVPVASVTVLLKKVEGPGDDFWINPDKKKFGDP